MLTYTDGAGVDRCQTCHTPIRTAADKMPIAPMRADELERIVRALATIADLLEDVTGILEKHAGRNAEQLRRAYAAAAEAIPDEIKTDRAGLLDEEADH
jgi:3-oxoacyl-[acyl-carrier-protein] synthase III